MSQLLYLSKLAVFKKLLKNGVFSEIPKRINVVPVHKKWDKSLVKIMALTVYFKYLVKLLKE